MSEPRWHVVCAPSCIYPDKDNEAVWTVSLDPNQTGWETDCGYAGYGLTRALAQELADAANRAHVHRETIKKWLAGRKEETTP